MCLATASALTRRRSRAAPCQTGASGAGRLPFPASGRGRSGTSVPPFHSLPADAPNSASLVAVVVAGQPSSVHCPSQWRTPTVPHLRRYRPSTGPFYWVTTIEAGPAALSPYPVRPRRRKVRTAAPQQLFFGLFSGWASVSCASDKGLPSCPASTW